MAVLLKVGPIVRLKKEWRAFSLSVSLVLSEVNTSSCADLREAQGVGGYSCKSRLSELSFAWNEYLQLL